MTDKDLTSAAVAAKGSQAVALHVFTIQRTKKKSSDVQVRLFGQDPNSIGGAGGANTNWIKCPSLLCAPNDSQNLMS